MQYYIYIYIYTLFFFLYILIKNFNDKLTFCFVGRLEESKGFFVLLEAIKSLSNIEWIDKLHCVGETTDSVKNENINSSENIPIIFHGILDRQRINKIYEDSHFIILPSQSEGFPKVLAEASSFGCIPIVPPIPSIISHIDDIGSKSRFLNELIACSAEKGFL